MIGGSGRSGTTILKKIFAAHPDVAKVPEWRFTTDPDGLIDFSVSMRGAWSPYAFDIKVTRLENLLKSIARTPHVVGWMRGLLLRSGLGGAVRRNLLPPYAAIDASSACPDFVELAESLIRDLTLFRYQAVWTGSGAFQSEMRHGPSCQLEMLDKRLAEFFRAVVVSTLTHQRKKRYVEDNTWNILYFDKLLEMLPEARLVHIHRHPFDVVCSYIKQQWAPRSAKEAAIFYRDVMNRWFEVKERLPGDTFEEIRLDDLVEDTEATLRMVCGFWELDWADELLSLDLSRSNSGRWKRELTPDDRREAGSILSPVIEKLGYSIDG